MLSGRLQAFWNAFQDLSAARSHSVWGAACGGFVSRLREGCSCPLAMYARSCSVVHPAGAFQRSQRQTHIVSGLREARGALSAQKAAAASIYDCKPSAEVSYIEA